MPYAHGNATLCLHRDELRCIVGVGHAIPLGMEAERRRAGVMHRDAAPTGPTYDWM